jgi:hypothetical protein
MMGDRSSHDQRNPQEPAVLLFTGAIFRSTEKAWAAKLGGLNGKPTWCGNYLDHLVYSSYGATSATALMPRLDDIDEY